MHWVPWAWTFALDKAGSNMPARMAIMAITTNNSINVKPRTAHDGLGLIIKNICVCNQTKRAILIIQISLAFCRPSKDGRLADFSVLLPATVMARRPESKEKTVERLMIVGTLLSRAGRGESLLFEDGVLIPFPSLLIRID